MKRAVAVLCCLSVLGLAVGACFSDRDGGLTGLSASCQTKAKAAGIPDGNVVIGIEGFAFQPALATVPRGKTVTWINCETTPGLAHTVTSDAGNVLASALIAPGQTYSVTFATPGTNAYHCTPHPNMKGQVVVQ